MTQQIEADLWNEFEDELLKIQSNTQPNQIINSQSEALDKFWNKFLTEKFPTGKINELLEKNFAIYICQNKLDINNIKSVYVRNNWKRDGLLGWIKKVHAGELKSFNVKELLMWANEYSKDLVPLLEEAKADLEIEPLPIIPIDELDNLPEQNDIWLCDKLIRPKSIGAIVGKRGTYKTWLALALALCISLGTRFLDKFKTEPCNVLFIDGESNKDEIKIRKRLVKKYLGINNAHNCFVLSEYYLKIDKPLGIKRLERDIKRLSIGLVIIDSYRRLISFSEDSATDTSQFFNDILKPVCSKTGVSFLFIHHRKKGRSDDDDMDTVRGSSDFANLMDNIIMVERVGKKMTIKQTKNKFRKELPNFNIELESDEKTFLGFKFLGIDEPYPVVCARCILKWAKGKKTFTYTKAKEFAESKNFKKETIEKSLIELQDRGKIEKGKSHKSPYKVISTDWAMEDIC